MSAAAEHHATRTLAQLYAVPAQRAPLAALSAIEAEIRGSVRPTVDHAVAHARLAWWREECTRVAAGRAQHPLTRALSDSLGADAPHLLRDLGGLVDTASWDLAQATFATRAEVQAYTARWSAAMLAPLVGRAAARTDTAGTIGAPLRELELLLQVVPDARAGRLRLPLDELTAAGSDAAQLAQPPWPQPLCALLRTRHAQLRAALVAAVAALAPPLQGELRGLIVWAALTCAHSRRAVRALPAAAATGDHAAAFDGWRAWRAARRAAAGGGLADP